MKIPFRGIVKNTPAGLAQDGELEDVLNLRYKDGAWRPIPDRSAIFSALPYTNVYIHSNSGYTHYLGVKSTKALEYFAQDVDGVPTLLQTPVALTTLTTDTAEFSQIGNVINIVDGGLKYLIWYDNAYVLIDSNFDGAQDSTTVGPVKVDLKVDGITNDNGFIETITVVSDSVVDKNTPLDTKIDLFKSLISKSNSILHAIGKVKGYFLAKTAIELYDGSIILHSQPVLMGQAWDVDTRYNFTAQGTNFDYITNKARWRMNQAAYSSNQNDPAWVVIKPEHIDELYTIDYYSGASIIGLPITPYKYPNTLVSIEGASTDGDMYHRDIRACVYSTSNNLKFKVNSNIDNKYKVLIKSISIYITQEIEPNDLDSLSLKERFFDQTTSENLTYESWEISQKTNEEIIKELAELRTFYKVHEIPFEQIQASPDWIDIDLKDKLGDALLTQEALPYDDFSHHSTLPQVAMTYNSKLHVANYKTLLSRGWPMNYFLPIQGIGQFEAAITQTTGSYMKWIKVKIKTNNGLSEVVRFDRRFGLTYENSNYFAPLLSYPDARATEITLYSLKITSGEVGFLSTKTFALTASKSNNFAYYIAPDLKPIDMSYSSTPIQGSLTQPPESNREQVYQNAMKVSEVNNPFTFPVQNTYQVGNGSITGIASNTIALSTGQFGEFPLYVFTTDGIWAMYVGGAEVNYTSSRPVSREVCNNPKSIKAIDTGVVFSTAKGIMVIAGSSTKELSEPIEGAVFDIDKLSLFKKALNHDKLTTLLSEVTGEDIHDYIASANVGYNYIESEIWFTNPLKSYSYVFSKGLWYKVKQTGNRFVDDYPKQYLLTGTGDLVDIASEVLITGSEGEERAASQQIMLLTRPLKFGDVEFKQMLTAIMRGQLTTVNLIEEATPTDIIHKKWTGIHVYGSYDGERWVFLGGTEKQGELNDIGTRIERTDCRYYRIALYGNVSLNSYINYLEMEGKQSILRTKLR